MIRALHALTAEPWAIRPDYLHFMAGVAGMDREARAANAESEGETWRKRDLAAIIGAFAGPTVRRMDGARYAMVTDAGIAILPVFGPIFPRANVMTEYSGGTSVAMLQNDYRLAVAAADIHAVMLLIDSPGGAVSGINAFADLVYQGRSSKFTLAHVSGTAASAAYWIGASASEFVTEKTGILGSIGVVAAIPKQVEPDGSGEVVIEVVSSNAPNKRPDPTTDEGLGEIRTMLDALEAQFIADVARARGVTATKVKEEFGAGGVKIGPQAVAAGMADKVQSYDASYRQLARLASNRKRAAALK
ncbi:S49 family peptidase [Ancylobacter defluvii]|uniref:Peptidase S49 n=1 Tax=Ancylobacter defluvii TaxID=1282440 RepID=A0A9W6K473_9HYPH|nr:S49 family peptidase [Ancylobacter defluvii]MBS7588282.1 S49 family peptidase [Ancylobacter defluvii]GLK86678.1 peptidase S49 [Ancylobacter defluvii]